MNLKSRRVRVVSGIAATALAMAGIAAATAPAAQASAQGAVTTTINESADGSNECLNGPGVVNCNIYTGKEFVWLSGIDTLKNGDYFFAVLNPSGQGSNQNPNDGTPNNLSDDYDSWTDRQFNVTDGVVSAISLGATHDLDSNKIRLYNYADTQNPGGVYILAVCRYDNTTYPVKPSDCKYDAFKVKEGDDDGGNPEVDAPVVVKDAEGAYDVTYVWSIDKSADRTTVLNQAGGTADFDYTLVLSHDGGTVSNVAVTGTITIVNPNEGDLTDVTISDVLSDSTVCTVDALPTPGVLPPGNTDVDYTCDLGTTVPEAALQNTVTVTYGAYTETNDTGSTTLPAGSVDFTTEDIDFTGTMVDDCVSIADYFDGSTIGTAVGSVCVGDPVEAFTIHYTIEDVELPSFGCYTFNNEAEFTTDDTDTTGSDIASVTTCGTIGHTMGFWQNKNGQALITGADQPTLGDFLDNYRPFQDKPAATSWASYTTTVIKNATAKGASMNAMLKAQMLATALTVYFTQPPHNGLNAAVPLGTLQVDTTAWKDGFGGDTSMTVLEMLDYAGNVQCTVVGCATSGWYVVGGKQSKVLQGYAKDAFDAINNEAF